MKKKLVKNTIGPDRYKHSRSFEIQSLEIVKVVVLILFVLVGRRVGGGEALCQQFPILCCKKATTWLEWDFVTTFVYSL